MKLLTRDEFRAVVFKRDKNKCVVCSAEAKDSHHLIERKLFANGGYFAENGVAVCNSCHLKAEQTLISCDELRKLAKINIIVLPEGIDTKLRYDKWLNIILEDGRRLPGPLFCESGVQKILKPVLYLFVR